MQNILKVLLHCAIFSATAEELQCNMLPLQLATFLLCATLHEVELSSTFCNNCSNYQLLLHSATPLQQLVSQCFAQSANQNPYYPLLGRTFASCWQSHCTV